MKTLLIATSLFALASSAHAAECPPYALNGKWDMYLPNMKCTTCVQNNITLTGYCLSGDGVNSNLTGTIRVLPSCRITGTIREVNTRWQQRDYGFS
jgi:hypothetical protein